MTNRKSTKRALICSLLALAMCFSMLVGTTFAWFTDSVSSANNIIQSGNLDVKLEYSRDFSTWIEVTNDTKIFSETVKWEPGYTDVVYFRISNIGSLSLKYSFGINVISEVEGKNAANKSFKLSDYIEYDVIDDVDAAYASRTDALAAVTDPAIISEDFAKNGTINAKEAAHCVALVIYMPETVGNDANHNGTDIPQINLGINLFATQNVAEADGFDNTYDKDAVFGTYIELEAGADLLAAMASAKADEPLTIKLNGDVKWPTDGHHGENDITPASAIVIDGNGYTITATGSGVTPLGDDKVPMTLKNVKIVDNSVSYDEAAWELSYLEMGGRVLNCVDVEFVDPITVDSDNATFTNCSFVGHYDKNSTTTTQYGVWVSNGNATFTNCTFTGTRGLKICDKYAPEVGTVVIDGCTFNGISEKPGIAIDDEDTQDMKITIKNSTFINCKAGDQGLYIYETDNTVPTLENNTVLNGTEVAKGVYYDSAKKTFTVASKEGLMNLSQELVKVSPNEANIQTVNLTCDVDLAGETWAPIESMWITFNGNGHTISNLTAGFDSAGRRSGFWGYAGAVSINDLTLHNVSVAGSQAGTFAGAAEGLKLNNCVLSGTNTVTYVDGVEEWNGIGAITGVLTGSTVNVTIAEGATVKLIKDGFTTDPGCMFQDNLTGYLAANSGTVVNNGTVEVIDVTIATAEELVSAFANLKAGNVLYITANIDMTGKTISPVTGNKGFTMYGNGYIISNLNTTAQALFVSHSGSSSYTFDNIVLENCSVNSASNYGALFVGDGDTSDAITITNCVVKNCNVTSAKYAAAFVAYTAGYNVVNNGPVYSDVLVENCSVIGGSITGGGSVGAAIGHAGGNDDTTTTVNNFTVDGVVINGEDAVHTGAIVGTANVGDTIINNATYSNVTGNYNGLYGRFVPGTTGKLVIDGVEN